MMTQIEIAEKVKKLAANFRHPVALIKWGEDGVKRAWFFQIKKMHVPNLIGVYESDTPSEDIVEDLTDMFGNKSLKFSASRKTNSILKDVA